jgi:hypothetical protein
METYSKEDRQYIAGFEAGCEFIVLEIERWGKQHHIFVADLLHHLRSGDDKKKSSIHDKKGSANWDLL